MLPLVSQIAELHQSIFEKLALHESAISNKEDELRKALEQGLQKCAAERETIHQRRMILEQAERLYRNYAEENRDVNAAASSQVTPTRSDSQSDTDSPAVTRVPVQAASAEPELAKSVLDLRDQLSADLRGATRVADNSSKRSWTSGWRSE